MTVARPSDYWFSSSALFVQLNAAGDRNYIHANCSSGSMVMCYMRGIDGLGFDNGHNYRRWTLIASPTVFHDDDPRYGAGHNVSRYSDHRSLNQERPVSVPFLDAGYIRMVNADIGFNPVIDRVEGIYISTVQDILSVYRNRDI